MSNLMNNSLYGKAGKADFTPDQLPANRFDLFFEMMRIRFSGLITMNLVSVLFALPALVWSVISYSVLVYTWSSRPTPLRLSLRWIRRFCSIWWA